MNNNTEKRLDSSVPLDTRVHLSPFEHDAVAELGALDVPFLKIASFEIVDLPLICPAAQTERPPLISTGMANLSETDEAVLAAVEGGAESVGLMQYASDGAA